MARRKTPEEWLEDAKQVIAQVEGFNTAHPHATWAEIETAVDNAISSWRRDLLEGSVQGHALADFRKAAERPHCPHCGAKLRAVGQKTRTLTTQGNQTVHLERTHGRCPACDAGIFPPG